ncbi:MAG: hypothetical protein WCP22_04875 [Chlamydiota bacterium]
MNCKTNIARLFAAAAAVSACVGVVPLCRAQVPTGPIAPLKKMEFKTVDPLGGAKLPSAAPGAGSASPGGAADSPIAVRKAGSAYYSDSAASQQTGVSGGGPAYSCPMTSRQPIRGHGGFTGYSDSGNRRGAQKAWSGNASDVKNMYR